MLKKESLKKYIDELIGEVQEELGESNVTGNVDGYQTPFAFSGTKDKEKRKKTATQLGYSVVDNDVENIDEGILQDREKALNNLKIGASVNGGGYGPFKKTHKNTFVSPSGRMYNSSALIKLIGTFSDFKINESITEAKTYKKGDKLKIKLPNGKKFDVVFDMYSRTKGVALGKFKDNHGEYDIKPFNLDTIVESVNEAAMNPVKKVVNAILKKHKVDAMKTTSTSVRGFHNIKNGGYKYDGNYFLQFYKVPQDTIVKIAAEMKKAGVKGVQVNMGNISADYTKTGLTNSQFEATINENRWLELKNDDSMHANKKLAVGLKELKYQLAEVEKFFSWYNKIKNINELDSDNYWKRTNSHIYKIKERIINIARTLQEIEK